ncbi:MAG: serine hydrolase domain-containing protein [Planctomycetota bacterium]|nr:serine hydrolase domain-containing protein [Planctomycetota bacterium]
MHLDINSRRWHPFTNVLLLVPLLWNAPVCGGEPGATRPADEAAGNQQIVDQLTRIRLQHHVPAIAAAVVTRQGKVTVGAVGLRKRGVKVPVTLHDRWHLGSETKAMTATLIARLVEQQRLRWDSTTAEVFPEASAKFHPAMRQVTVLQLLCHRSGLPANLDLSQYRGAATAERQRAVIQELAKPPLTHPGSTYAYSNLGYLIAGAMVEKVTGRPWRTNMMAEVFTPLKMQDVGFGGVGTPGKLDQPWGHTAAGDPVHANGPAVDNPPVMGPAGRVHSTIQDWAKFVQDHLSGAAGGVALLQKDSYPKLHTPPLGGNYALGWLVLERGWGGGTVLHHAGSNTMNYANVWVAPERGFAVLVCVNQGGNAAFRATDAVASALIDLHSRGKLH